MLEILLTRKKQINHDIHICIKMKLAPSLEGKKQTNKKCKLFKVSARFYFHLKWEPAKPRPLIQTHAVHLDRFWRTSTWAKNKYTHTHYYIFFFSFLTVFILILYLQHFYSHTFCCLMCTLKMWAETGSVFSSFCVSSHLRGRAHARVHTHNIWLRVISFELCSPGTCFRKQD